MHVYWWLESTVIYQNCCFDSPTTIPRLRRNEHLLLALHPGRMHELIFDQVHRMDCHRHENLCVRLTQIIMIICFVIIIIASLTAPCTEKTLTLQIISVCLQYHCLLPRIGDWNVWTKF